MKKKTFLFIILILFINSWMHFGSFNILRPLGKGFVAAVGGVVNGTKMLWEAGQEYRKRRADEAQNIEQISADALPEEPREYFRRYEKDNWQTTSSELEGKTRAGSCYSNENGLLPKKSDDGLAITYKEFDAETTLSGGMRGSRRFVHGSNGKTYYTKDYFRSFQEVIGS